MKMNNKKLFYYGLKARIKEGLGVFLGFIGIVLFSASMFNKSFIWISVFLMVIAGYLVITGKAQRFDYQRNSGTIIHRGDF